MIIIEDTLSKIFNNTIDFLNIEIDYPDIQYWSEKYIQSEQTKKLNYNFFFDDIIINHTMNINKLISIFTDDGKFNIEEITLQQFLEMIGVDPSKYFKIGASLRAFEEQRVSFESIVNLTNDICDFYQNLKATYFKSSFLQFLCSLIDVFIGNETYNVDIEKLRKIFKAMIEEHIFMDERQLTIAGNEVIAARGNLRSLITLKEKMELPKRTPIPVNQTNFTAHRRKQKNNQNLVVKIPDSIFTDNNTDIDQKESIDSTSIDEYSSSIFEAEQNTIIESVLQSSYSEEIDSTDAEPTTEESTEMMTENTSNEEEEDDDENDMENPSNQTSKVPEEKDEYVIPQLKSKPVTEHHHKEKWTDKALDAFFDILDNQMTQYNKHKIKKHKDKKLKDKKPKVPESPLRMPIKKGSYVPHFIPDELNYVVKKEEKNDIFEDEFLYHNGKVAVADLKEIPLPTVQPTRTPRPKVIPVHNNKHPSSSIDERIEQTEMNLERALFTWRLEKEAAFMKLIVDKNLSTGEYFPIENFLYDYTLADQKGVLRQVSMSIVKNQPILLTTMKMFYHRPTRLGKASAILGLITKNLTKSTKNPTEYMWSGFTADSNFDERMGLIFGSILGMNTSGFIFDRKINRTMLYNSSFYRAMKSPLLPKSVEKKDVLEIKKMLKTNSITMETLMSRLGINYTMKNIEHLLGKVISVLENAFPMDCHGSNSIIQSLKNRYNWLKNTEPSTVTPVDFAKNVLGNVQQFNDMAKCFLNNETLGDLLKAINPNFDIETIISNYQTKRMPSIANLLDLFFHRKKRLHFESPLFLYYLNLRLVEGSKQVIFEEILKSEGVVWVDRIINRLSKWSFSRILTSNFGKQRNDILLHIFGSLEKELL